MLFLLHCVVFLSLHLIAQVGRTPFLLACRSGHLSLAKRLVNEFGVDPLQVEKVHAATLFVMLPCAHDVLHTRLLQDGRTALHYACRFRHLDIAKYLVDECGVSPCTKDKVRTLTHMLICSAFVFVPPRAEVVALVLANMRSKACVRRAGYTQYTCFAFGVWLPARVALPAA